MTTRPGSREEPREVEALVVAGERLRAGQPGDLLETEIVGIDLMRNPIQSAG